MPSLETHQSAETTKMLFIGDSGAGKTGALASLVQAGYNLRIIDVDNGLDVLRNVLRSGTYGAPSELVKKVSFTTITDPMKSVNGKLIPAKATVWQRVITTLDTGKFLEKDGKTVAENFGPLTTWTPQDVLVIDSLSFLAKAALNFTLAMNGRLGGRVEQSDWFSGQTMLEGLMEMLYDEGVRCNIIVCCHIAYIGEDNGPQKGYPATLGRALSPKIGRYFNSALMAQSVGQGSTLKRSIITTTKGLVELKNSNPTKVAPTYPLESGLADYFRDVRK